MRSAANNALQTGIQGPGRGPHETHHGPGRRYQVLNDAGTAAQVPGYRIAGKTGTAEKSVDLGGFRRMMDQAWWCGYGPTDKPELVVCVLIENGGHGGTAAAPAALKVFESYFGKKATSQTYVPSD